jgi:hypothetical protein
LFLGYVIYNEDEIKKVISMDYN